MWSLEPAGRPEQEQPLGIERARHHLSREARCRQAELVVGRTGHCEIALLRREGPFDHAQGLHELRNDEVGVREPIAVGIAHFVERSPIDGKFDVLSFAGIEAAQIDLIRMTWPPSFVNRTPGARRSKFAESMCGTLASFPTLIA